MISCGWGTKEICHETIQNKDYKTNTWSWMCNETYTIFSQSMLVFFQITFRHDISVSTQWQNRASVIYISMCFHWGKGAGVQIKLLRGRPQNGAHSFLMILRLNLVLFIEKKEIKLKCLFNTEVFKIPLCRIICWKW